MKSENSQIEYIEHPMESEFINFFISGIGLNYRDFENYLASKNISQRSIALTIPGFAQNKDIKSSYSMDQQAEKIAGFIKQLYEDELIKGINLYLFSFAADLGLKILPLLMQYKVPVYSVIFCDININESSAFITSHFEKKQVNTLQDIYKKTFADTRTKMLDLEMSKYIKIVQGVNQQQLKISSEEVMKNIAHYPTLIVQTWEYCMNHESEIKPHFLFSFTDSKLQELLIQKFDHLILEEPKLKKFHPNKLQFHGINGNHFVYTKKDTIQELLALVDTIR
ncbi:hypothetical protein MJH12_12595 [bacterium]|nr:hypothetical protein [bacterium]